MNSSLPAVTIALIAVTVLVYLFELNPRWNVKERLALKSDWVVKEHQWYRVFSAMFVHFGFFHILLNMLALYYFGELVEAGLQEFPGGAVWRYLIIYLVSGICGSLSVLLKDKIRHTDEMSGGASGAIFGLLGALLIMLMKNNPAISEQMNLGILMADIVIMLIPGFTSKRVSLASHIGGLLAGMLLGLALV